ncbi:RNA 2',3'-cyclic phosphodiesterase [Candidatus Borrarchaeum sp.]|uniref:RNA 2',3'-cyclic phosphodiesterase n=1 Tax=Candidatus Borrarchaeum sp. TaxID=2846742 RepID=UPI0025796AE7|nr:RNA 2',3'-cyclic phosphodiesterase [Candidatus Borrarchaeum sp.]
MGKISEQIRAFLAIDIDEHLFDKIREIQDSLIQIKDDLRLVPLENIHITLEFLGNLPPSMVDEISRIMQAISLEPFNLEFKGVGIFNPKFIRVVWIGTGDGSKNAISLAEDLKKRLKTLGVRITKKRFTPHATIARVKSKRNTRELARSIQELSEIKIGTMMVTSFKLKKSELRPRGPIYTDLKIRQLEPLQ